MEIFTPKPKNFDDLRKELKKIKEVKYFSWGAFGVKVTLKYDDKQEIVKIDNVLNGSVVNEKATMLSVLEKLKKEEVVEEDIEEKEPMIEKLKKVIKKVVKKEK